MTEPPCGPTQVDIATVCHPCAYPCASCYTDINTCLTCAGGNHIFSQNSCTCPSGTFDNGTTGCDSCDQKCLECSGSTETNCTACKLNMSLVNGECKSDKGFFWNGISSEPCSSKCLACSGTSTQCSECSSNYILSEIDNSCTCGEAEGSNLIDDGLKCFCKETCGF